MSDHLIMEPRLDTDATSQVLDVLARIDPTTESSDNEEVSDGDAEQDEEPEAVVYVPDEYQSRSVSNLEQYFDQKFQGFPLTTRSVDWSMRETSDNGEVEGRDYDSDEPLHDDDASYEVLTHLFFKLIALITCR